MIRVHQWTAFALAGITVALAAWAVSPAGARAQDLPWTSTSTINAGVMMHRLDGRGTDPFFAFRTDYVVSDRSVAELTLGYGEPEQDSGRSRFMLAEGHYQLQWPVAPFAPFVGMGGGVVGDRPMAEGDTSWSPTFSVGAGIRAWIDERARIRTDVRWRGVGADFDGTSLEWTFGVGWRW